MSTVHVMNEHRLRFRHVDGWTLYACACGGFDDDAGSDEEARRVYEAHAQHARAAEDEL